MSEQVQPISYLTIKEIQKLAHVGRDAVTGAIARGDLKAHKPKGSRLIRISQRDFDRWMSPRVTTVTANLGGDDVEA